MKILKFAFQTVNGPWIYGNMNVEKVCSFIYLFIYLFILKRVYLEVKKKVGCLLGREGHMGVLVGLPML